MNMGEAKLDNHTLYVGRLVGLAAPVILTLYGLLVALNLAPGDHFAGIMPFLLLSFGWIGFGVIQYITPTSDRLLLLSRLVVNHAFAAMYIALVSGFSLAFLSGWALLYLLAYLYLSVPGFVASVTTLALLCLIDIDFHNHSGAVARTMLLNVLGTVLVGVAAVSISYLRAKERTELERSKQREEIERNRLQTIVNNLSDAVLSTDHRGVVQLYNAACLNLLDTNSKLDGKNINTVLPLDDEDGKRVDISKRLKRTNAVTIDDTLRMGSVDDPMRIELTLAPIRSTFEAQQTAKGKNGFIIIARDVTKKKSLEEERDEFISVVSHELRTPIAVTEGLLSNIQLMLERDRLEKDNFEKNIAEAHEQVLFLSGMINDLSTLSRAERGVADDTESIDVAELAHELYNEYLPESQKRKLHFDLEMGTKLGHVNASRLYLHELLQNFVTNALKYTKEGSVTLSIHRRGSVVHFAVKDTGIGISKSDQKRVFEKFYRSEDYRTRETGGTGLGLYVASKLARKLGTSIDLTSRLNHGSTFSFSLDAEKD
ncbi:MAG TPA: ATP-binding protein [Candidatus Saccharibacteria bacterium]|nr:ATP-binding protein [Candidatus Saccharibacteria bacterium]